jgi:hypothetical protein
MAKLFPTNTVGAEIGVHRGDFAEVILETAKPRLFYLIDPWPSSVSLANGADCLTGDDAFACVVQRFILPIQAGKVVTVRQPCVRALAGLGRIFNWLYLDTYHLYPDTLFELRACAGAILPGGMLAGHDLDLVSVQRAVAEFCAESNWRLRYVTAEGNMSFLLTQTG